MRRSTWLIAAAIVLAGCSHTCRGSTDYPGPYCISSYRTVYGDRDVDEIRITWSGMNCGDDAAIDTIACMCRNNTLPGIRFSGCPDLIRVDVNSGELKFDIYNIGREGDIDEN